MMTCTYLNGWKRECLGKNDVFHRLLTFCECRFFMSENPEIPRFSLKNIRLVNESPVTAIEIVGELVQTEAPSPIRPLPEQTTSEQPTVHVRFRLYKGEKSLHFKSKRI